MKRAKNNEILMIKDFKTISASLYMDRWAFFCDAYHM